MGVLNSAYYETKENDFFILLKIILAWYIYIYMFMFINWNA